MPTPTATERLAQFIHDLDPAKLPSAVREQATLCVLDTLGIAMAGMSEPSARAVWAVARSAGGREESRVLVSGERLPAQGAALVNGTAAFAHNFTDTTLTCILHAGRAVGPAALAAVVAGVEARAAPLRKQKSPNVAASRAAVFGPMPAIVVSRVPTWRRRCHAVSGISSGRRRWPPVLPGRREAGRLRWRR